MHVRAAVAVVLAALVAAAPALAQPARAALAPSPAVAAPTEATAVAPKVVIVVGATESVTPTYRSMADAIAAEALKWTPNVVKVYSPNATWAAVAAAATGASIFVYLGHGNGFPSPYRTTLDTSTEDGMGLNTQLGLGDTDKKYYGEASVATLRLAPNAIVFLNHLCYAPGAGEPGAPEPSISVAEQRVDNYASGFIRAGARTVMADDDTGVVEASIRGIFSSHQPFLNVWRSLLSANGHEIPFTPGRNQAFQAILDPQTWTTGFMRSIVADPTLSTDDIVAGAALAPTNTAPQALAAPGNATVSTPGLPVYTDATLTTPTGTTFASGTKLHVDALADQPAAPDGTTPPPAAQVETLDASVSGWVSGGGLSPADASGPALRSMTGDTTISPNFDGQDDRLNLWARLSEPASWTWTLSDGDGTVVRTQSGSADLFALTWDGLPGGNPAPAGTYHWTLHATDGWGNPALDTGGDVTVVSQPIPATAVLSFTSLVGTSTHTSPLAYQIVFATAVSGFSAADLARTGTATACVVGAPSGGPTTWFVTVSSCSDGTVGLSLRAGSVLDATSTAGPPVDVAAPTVRLDRTKPSEGAPKTSFRAQVALGGTAMPVTLTWSASDTGSGITTYDVARSLDGAAFKTLATGLTTATLGTSVAGGHSYRFEVRAHDKAGNVSAWVAGPTMRPSLVQQTATGLTWAGAWTTVSGAAYSGGSERQASAAGASLSYTFTGRAIGLLASRDPAYGQVKVYIDGAYVVTTETAASSHLDRAVVFSRTLTWGTHTIKLVVVGTAGRPTVALDAFEVLN
jgi:hypothetical protein